MYPKNKILDYKEFAGYRDILAVLLRDDLLYSIGQARAILEGFLKKEVQ